MYIAKTLEKFYKNKEYKYFPGCSIVKNFDNKDLINTITEIKNEMVNSKLFDKYVFLKETSYHMTVCDIYAYDLSKINSKKQIDLIDQDVYLKLKDLDFSLNVEMEVIEITAKKILLKPKTSNDEKTLKKFRQKVYQRLNEKNNEDYIFHISLSYNLIKTNEEETTSIKEFLKELTNKYKNKLSSIYIDIPTLVLFNDMSEFKDINEGRSALGVTSYNID